MKPFTTRFLLFFLLHSTTISAVSPPSTLDPKQLQALQSLDIPTKHDPCTQPISTHNATVCDNATPFRHVTTLRLTNCSDDLSLSTTALSSLSTLTTLTFLNCHVNIVHFPTSLTNNLRSFTSINSLQKLTGVFLSRFRNLTELIISGDPIKASGIHIIISNMESLDTLTLSNTTINGTIPTSITLLESLKFVNLSSNRLIGEIPNSLSDLIYLQNLSLSSNSLSGSIPESISTMSRLLHLDLSSNQFNGTIPRSVSAMKGLKYLNLQNNNFHGVMPFNESFIKRLVVFKINGNDNLCYNHSMISKKLKLGIAQCDKHGLPIMPPPAADDGPSDDTGSDDYVDDSSSDNGKKKNNNDDHGPNKVVLGVAIGLSAVVFLIIFLVMLSKCGGRCCCC